MSTDYTVNVDDNFHYMDADERYTAGRFATLEEAVAFCEAQVREALEYFAEEARSVEDLLDTYRSFGEDPWIAGPPEMPRKPFSAWTYAERIAAEVYARVRGG